MRSVFTVATGTQVYLNYALALARSFVTHNSLSDIKFFIMTDLESKLPADLQNIELIQVNSLPIGKGITSKLFLDQLAPTEKSLFIDADCLCYGSLVPVFEKFEGHSVSVVGFPISEGGWCGIVAEDLCRKFEVEHISRFNGGVYYIERGKRATQIYETARNLLPNYDQLGLPRHRGWANEEPLMSMALAIHGETAVIDDGSILSDLASCLDRAVLDVLIGKCQLTNPPLPDPKHKWWYKRGTYYPLIIHFSGPATMVYPYTKEKLNLNLTRQLKFPAWLAYLASAIGISLPYKATKIVKSALRPLYRALFGYRKIAQSDRTFDG